MIICQDDNASLGGWSSAKPTCTKRSCNIKHESILHGKVSCTDNERYQSVCTFTCDSEYELIGNDATVCLSNIGNDTLTWSTPSPTCKEIDQCVANPDICGEGGTCTKITGGYVCQCGIGFSLGGLNTPCYSDEETFPLRLTYNKTFSASLKDETSQDYKELSNTASSHVKDIFELETNSAQDIHWVFSKGSIIADSDIPLSTLRVISIEEARNMSKAFNNKANKPMELIAAASIVKENNPAPDGVNNWVVPLVIAISLVLIGIISSVLICIRKDKKIDEAVNPSNYESDYVEPNPSSAKLRHSTCTIDEDHIYDIVIPKSEQPEKEEVESSLGGAEKDNVDYVIMGPNKDEIKGEDTQANTQGNYEVPIN